ncbi:hypothetical protein KC326_g179 [Hortaea werneckii]|nr:hypothetical protein KC326_g179 [Hortaea werneckii]
MFYTIKSSSSSSSSSSSYYYRRPLYLTASNSSPCLYRPTLSLYRIELSRLCSNSNSNSSRILIIKRALKTNIDSLIDFKDDLVDEVVDSRGANSNAYRFKSASLINYKPAVTTTKVFSSEVEVGFVKEYRSRFLREREREIYSPISFLLLVRFFYRKSYSIAII